MSLVKSCTLNRNGPCPAANRILSRHVLFATMFLLSLAIPSRAFAIAVTTDYSFDTPTFANPVFAPLNALLATAGATISGSVSFDTDDVTVIDHVMTGKDLYFDPAYSHAGELDSIGFNELSTQVTTLTGDTTMTAIGAWIMAPTALDQLSILIDFENMVLGALCLKLATGGCANTMLAGISEDQPAANLTLVETVIDDPGPVAPVTEPGVLAALGFGFAMLALAQRPRRQGSRTPR